MTTSTPDTTVPNARRTGGSVKDVQPDATLVSLFRSETAVRGPAVAFRSRDSRQNWSTTSWYEYGRMVERFARSLVDWGVEPGDRVAILSENRLEWHVADMAVLTVGAVSVPLYPTSAPAQVAYVLQHCGAKVCVVSGPRHLQTVVNLPSLVSLKRIVHFDDLHGLGIPLPNADLKITPWSEGVGPRDATAGDGTTDTAEDVTDAAATVASRADAVAPGDVATIVYTSGTTGAPKGVVLTHRNITATIDMIIKVVPLSVQDRFLSFLPLSHIAERVVSHFGQIASGGETWFATSYTTVGYDMLDCRPTVFFAVPRVWEKVRVSFEVAFHELSGPRRFLIERFRQVSLKRLDEIANGGTPGRVLTTAHRALDRTVGTAVRRKLGMDRARALFSGAAPIDPDLLRWLGSIGLMVGQVYGQTEVCGPTTITPLNDLRFESVGRALPGVEVKIADDGEILVRGANVCRGYYRNDEATAALFEDGWMLTGDLGTLTGDGHLVISGRKKDLMKTSQGKYVAPQELELRLQSVRFVKQGVAVAEGRPFITALLFLDPEEVLPWAEHRGKPTDLSALAGDPDVLSAVGDGVKAVNAELSHAEQIKQWVLCATELTVDRGELTPTLKVVRTKTLEHFSDTIEAMYNAGRSPER